MNTRRPPLSMRFFAYLNRKIPAVQFFRKVLVRVFDVDFDQYVRGKGYYDIISLNKNTQICLWLDEHIDIIIWWQGFYEKVPSLAFKSLLKKDDFFIDVGANIGYYSLIASTIVGEKGKVFAFEPVTSIFRKLSINTLNHDNVAIIQAACGQYNGTDKIYVADKWCTAGSRISAPIENQLVVTEEIKLIKLDDYLDGQKVNVVKIDVEGYETNVLKGMESTLKQNPDVKIFIEVNKKLLAEAGSSPEDIFEYLKSFSLMPWKIIYKNKSLKLLLEEKYWGDENLILFARKESIPESYI